MRAIYPLISMSIALVLITASPTDGQEGPNNGYNDPVEGIMGGGPAGIYSRLAWELSVVMESVVKKSGDKADDRLRILAVMGKGSRGNITDLLKLKKIGMAIVQLDVLDDYKAKVDGNLSQNIRYLTKLHNEEVHLITRRNIKSLDDFKRIQENRRPLVNVGSENSGSHVTARNIFKRLGIRPAYKHLDQRVAREELRRIDGQMDAVFYVVGKPTPLVEEIKAEDGLHLLPLEEDLGEPYNVKTNFTAEDYGTLISPGGSISTIAIPSVLLAYNFKKGSFRWKNVGYFDKGLPSALEKLTGSGAYHPKWLEVNLDESIGGSWKRWGE